MLPVICLVLAAAGQPPDLPISAATTSAQKVSPPAAPPARSIPLDRRLYLGMNQLGYLSGGPNLSFALLAPQQYMALEAQVQALDLDLSPSSPLFDAFAFSLRAGPMLRLGLRDDSGRGMTGDFRLLAAANFLSLQDGTGRVYPSVAAETEITYWLSASLGVSLRLQAEVLMLASTAGVAVGLAF